MKRNRNGMATFDQYLSPFSWRYASDNMRHIWSEINKRQIWRRIWLCLAEVQSQYGLVASDQVQEISQQVNQVDMQHALAIEAEIHHDLMAELKTFAGQCGTAGGVLHLGATSMDIEDNADALRIRAALDLVLGKLDKLLMAFASQIESWADIPIIAFTHLQPAEPSTLGYRLASYAQDLLEDRDHLTRLRNSIRGKGFKGAVGTGASYVELVGPERYNEFEQKLSALLDIPFYTIATQTYPRKQDYQVISELASVGATLYKFAFDLRLLQSPQVGELSEPFGLEQVGSSAMPFKRNPIQSEKINSLARSLANMPQLAWHNAAHSLLERTLDDSANRRTLLPEAFLITDEILSVAMPIVENLSVNTLAIQRNLATYAPFAGCERLLMHLVKAGANRQDMHEILRKHAMHAWQVIQQGEPNPLIQIISTDPTVLAFLQPDQIYNVMQVEDYTGIAVDAAHRVAKQIRQSIM